MQRAVKKAYLFQVKLRGCYPCEEVQSAAAVFRLILLTKLPLLGLFYGVASVPLYPIGLNPDARW